jgi:hypothetical protein
MPDNEVYKSAGFTLHEDTPNPDLQNWLDIHLWAFPEGTPGSRLEIKLYSMVGTKCNSDNHFKGTLAQLTELVLLGITYKAQLAKEAKS